MCAFFGERGFNTPPPRLTRFSLLAESGSVKWGLRSPTGHVEGEEERLWLNVLEQTCKIKWRLSDGLNIRSVMRRNVHRERTCRETTAPGARSRARGVMNCLEP